MEKFDFQNHARDTPEGNSAELAEKPGPSRFILKTKIHAMHSTLLQLPRAVWHARIAWFYPIWTTITIIAAISSGWIVANAPIPSPQSVEEKPTKPRLYLWTRGNIAALTLLALFLACYIEVVVVKWEDFADFDDSYFTLYTLKGRNFGPPIWNAMGRFFPFGHQEFNLIGRLTKSNAGYHVFPIVQVLILCCILLALAHELSIGVRTALIAIILIFPSLIVCFSGLVYPDRNVVFWVTCLAFFVSRFERTHATVWAVASVICGQIMIYYKETAVFLLAGFAISRLVLRYWSARTARLKHTLLGNKESVLDLCFISLGVFLFLYYAAAMFPRPNLAYVDLMGVSRLAAITFYVEVDPLAWVFVSVVMYRTYRIMRHQVQPELLWDGLAYGGAVCFTSYLILGLIQVYYTAPIDLVAVLYLARLAFRSWNMMPRYRRAIGLGLACIFIFYVGVLSALRLYERKNLIHAKAKIADVIKDRVLNSTRNEHRLFFPFTKLYILSEFASYLTYRGIPLEVGTDDPETPGGVVIASTSASKDMPCEPYISIMCRAAARPEPGDLVIGLPDDAESAAEIDRYRNAGAPIYQYSPLPRIPGWLFPLVNNLRAIAILENERQGIPDRWLRASVTLWK